MGNWWRWGWIWLSLGLLIALYVYMGIAASGKYDLVCYGHDHTLFQEQVGKSLLINPGEIMGRFGRSTFMLVGTADRSVTVVDVD